MNRFPFSVCAATFSVALALTFTGVSPSIAETYRWGDSTASVQQHGGSHQSQSDVTRFEGGHRIITQDGNNTDITIQQEGHSNPLRFDAEKRLGDSNHRFGDPDFERRFSQPDAFDSDGSSSSRPETSQLQKFFLLRMMERLGWHFMPKR